MTERKKLSILGGGGFIGSHLSKYLLHSTDHEITILDQQVDKLNPLLDKPLEETRAETVVTDIQNETDTKLERLIEDSDIVLDLIAHANPSQYMKIPLEVVDLNFFENLRIVDVCRKHGIRLIQFSTCEVYGKTQYDGQVFSEDESDFLVGPVSEHRWIYSCAKQLLERMIHAHGLEGNLEYSIIRPFNFMGPYMDYLIDEDEMGGPRVMAQFISSLLYGHPMYLVDGGTNYRSFTFIDDAVRAIALVVENEDGYFDNEIINVGSPENEITIRDLAYKMNDLYEDLVGGAPSCEIQEVSAEEFYGEGYGDSDRRIPDISKLTRAGWEPEYDLTSTLKETIKFYIEQKKPQLIR